MVVAVGVQEIVAVADGNQAISPQICYPVFSTFQTQPGNASRRFRRSGSILSLFALCLETHPPSR